MNCSMCSGVAMLLGILGKLAWWRCRNCGAEFSSSKEEAEEAYP